MRILIFLSSLLLAVTGWAADLSKHIDKDIPATTYFSKVVNDTPEMLTIGEAQFMLYKLGYYPSLPNGENSKLYQDAVKKFQNKINAKVTGILTAGEWYQLLAQYNNHPENIPMKEVHPMSFSFEQNPSNVFIKGTWQFENPDMEMLAPIQTSDIRCDRSNNACAEARALLVNFPDQDLMDADLVIWQVTKWDNNEIIAENDSAECVAYTLFINLQKETVSQSRRGKGCFGVSTDPTTILLQDGNDIAKKYYQEQAARYSTSITPPKVPATYKP